MAKANKQNAKNTAYRPLNARISYLFEAAKYLHDARSNEDDSNNGMQSPRDMSNVHKDGADAEKTISDAGDEQSSANVIREAEDAQPPATTPSPNAVQESQLSATEASAPPTTAIPRTRPFLGTQTHLLTHLRSVSLKSQIRLSHDVKHAICKRCNALLITEETCKVGIENKSKGGRKKWADVRVVECLGCGAKRRWPVGARRGLKKRDRVVGGEGEGGKKIGAKGKGEEQ